MKICLAMTVTSITNTLGFTPLRNLIRFLSVEHIYKDLRSVFILQTSDTDSCSCRNLAEQRFRIYNQATEHPLNLVDDLKKSAAFTKKTKRIATEKSLTRVLNDV